jgi:hypothetical protein
MALICTQFVADWIFLLENLLEKRFMVRLLPLFLLGPVGHRIGLFVFIVNR